MPVARVVTRIPRDAAAVSEELRAQGYTVEVVAPDQMPNSPAELEVYLERFTAEEALAQAQRFADSEAPETPVLVAPGALARPQPTPPATVPAAVAAPPPTAQQGQHLAPPEPAVPVAAAARPARSKPRRPSPRWGAAMKAAVGQAGEAFRWAGQEAGRTFIAIVMVVAAALRGVGSRLHPVAVRGRAAAAQGSKSFMQSSRATLTSARLWTAECIVRLRRSFRLAGRRAQAAHTSVVGWESAVGRDWRAAWQARRAHQQILKERAAAQRLQDLQAEREREAARLAAQARTARTEIAPLPGTRPLPAVPPPLPVAQMRWGRTLAVTGGLALLVLLLWNAFGRPTEHLPQEVPQAGVQQLPFTPKVQAEEVKNVEPGAAQSAPAEPIPEPTIRRHEPEVVIRHFEPPPRREPTRQQSSVKRITDQD